MRSAGSDFQSPRPGGTLTFRILDSIHIILYSRRSARTPSQTDEEPEPTLTLFVATRSDGGAPVNCIIPACFPGSFTRKSSASRAATLRNTSACSADCGSHSSSSMLLLDPAGGMCANHHKASGSSSAGPSSRATSVPNPANSGKSLRKAASAASGSAVPSPTTALSALLAPFASENGKIPSSSRAGADIAEQKTANRPGLFESWKYLPFIAHQGEETSVFEAPLTLFTRCPSTRPGLSQPPLWREHSFHIMSLGRPRRAGVSSSRCSPRPFERASSTRI